MEKIVFKTDFKILKRKLIKVFIFIVILCLWMFVPNIQNFPVNESSIHLKIIIFPILSAIWGTKEKGSNNRKQYFYVSSYI